MYVHGTNGIEQSRSQAPGNDAMHAEMYVNQIV